MSGASGQENGVGHHRILFFLLILRPKYIFRLILLFFITLLIILQGDLSVLETRLEKLEKELQRNRVVLTQLKDTVKSWISVEPEYGNDLVDAGHHAGLRNIVKMTSTEYQFCSKPSVESTENVRDPYYYYFFILIHFSIICLI